MCTGGTYSPRISEVLIPDLYLWAKANGVAMTTLVNRIIYQQIKKHKKGEEYKPLKVCPEFPDRRFGKK
jgi:hypothetical protein